MNTLLLVDDDDLLLNSVQLMFADDPTIQVLKAHSAKEAYGLITHQAVDVIISDQNMPQVNGTDFLRYVHEHFPTIQRIILTGDARHKTPINAINQAGVFRFLLKPSLPSEIVGTVTQALEMKRLRLANEVLTNEVVAQNAVLSRLNVSLEKTVTERTVQLRKTLEILKARHATLQEQRTGVAELLIAMIGQYDLIKGRTARQIWESIRFFAEKIGHPLSDEMPYAALLKVFVDPKISDGDDTFLRLLASVDGFSPIAGLIMGCHENFDGTGPTGSEGGGISMEARLLKIAADYFDMKVESRTEARRYILNQSHKMYDPELSRAFLATCHDDLGTAEYYICEVENLYPGMVLCYDVQLLNGTVLLPAGTSLNTKMIAQLQKVMKMMKTKIKIYNQINKSLSL